MKQHGAPPPTPSPMRLPSLAALALFFLYAPDALASGDIVGKGHGLIDFLSHSVGPIIIGIGVLGAAGAMVFGIPGAVQKLILVVIGGIMMTSVGSVISLIAGF